MPKKTDDKQRAQEQARAGLPEDADYRLPYVDPQEHYVARPEAWTLLASWDVMSQPRVQTSRSRHCHAKWRWTKCWSVS